MGKSVFTLVPLQTYTVCAWSIDSIYGDIAILAVSVFMQGLSCGAHIYYTCILCVFNSVSTHSDNDDCGHRNWCITQASTVYIGIGFKKDILFYFGVDFTFSDTS